MAEHIRYARNRREFLTDCFCGAGCLAFASMLAESQARAARYNPLAPKPPHMPDKAKAKAFIFVYMAGGPSHLETWDPKPLLNQLNGQKRPAEFGEVKYQNVNSESRILGCKRTFQKYGKSGIEVSRPVPAPGGDCGRPVRGALHARRHGGALGGAVPDDDRPRGAGLSGDGKLGGVRAGVGSGIAAGVCGDAGPARRAGSGPADVQERLPAGGLPAHHAASGRQAGVESGPAEGRLAGGAAQDDRPDPQAERGQPAGRGRGVRGAHFGLRHGVQDADRSAGSFRHQQGTARDRSTCTAWATRSTDDYGAPLPAGAAHGGEGRALRLRGLGRRRGGYRMGRAQRHRDQPHQDGLDDGQAGGRV